MPYSLGSANSSTAASVADGLAIRGKRRLSPDSQERAQPVTGVERDPQGELDAACVTSAQPAPIRVRQRLTPAVGEGVPRPCRPRRLTGTRG
jgi:hypothetical protein